MEDGLFKLFAVSAVTMGLAQTLTRERICAWFRVRCDRASPILGYLVSCPYCASHYIAFVLVPLTGAYYLTVDVQWGLATTLLNWFLSSILITVVAAFLRVIFWFVDEGQALVRKQKVSLEEDGKTQRLEQERLKADLHERRQPPAPH